ncbi:ABC-2 type transport system permease protein [Symbiobacterium terraclitae]|uniref:ABC-2 type transport system permease protein n=1 Tax=Symbiobacterium terraclitae TaxID=557451 RepID=A0ABS4JS76_9FIRM|nr:ABC transporter permease [Symbiobacterium terraclitae]MBP2017314.1 ABC-2 type transport system permease protein [Symbiobacterium terraclitae]
MRFFSLVRGEFWALKRNRRLAVFILVMLGMAAVYALDAQDSATFLPVVLVVAIYSSVWQMTVTSLVEEKERRTLEALLVTPARPLEIIGAKAAVGVLLAALMSALILLVFRQPPQSPLVLLSGLALAIGFATASGALIGIVARDMKTSSLYRTPLLAVLVGGTIIPWHESGWAIAEVMRWLPARPVQELIWGGWTGAPVPLAQDAAVMLAYTVLLLAVGARILRQQATSR